MPRLCLRPLSDSRGFELAVDAVVHGGISTVSLGAGEEGFQKNKDPECTSETEHNLHAASCEQ